MNDLDIKKKAFVDAYKKTYGNISKACEIVGINRGTFYNWEKNNKAFKKAIEDVEPEEEFLDFVEDALTKKIKSGDTTAIIFALKTKGKNRGYIERTEQVVKNIEIDFTD